MKTRTRTIRKTIHEIRMVKIYCPDWTFCAQGFCAEEIKGHVFLDEPYDETKDYDEIFRQAKAEAEANFRDWSYDKDVRMDFYWKEVEA